MITATQDAGWVELRLKRTPRANRNEGKFDTISSHKSDFMFLEAKGAKIPSPTSIPANTTSSAKEPSGRIWLTIT